MLEEVPFAYLSSNILPDLHFFCWWLCQNVYTINDPFSLFFSPSVESFPSTQKHDQIYSTLKFFSFEPKSVSSHCASSFNSPSQLTSWKGLLYLLCHTLLHSWLCNLFQSLSTSMKPTIKLSLIMMSSLWQNAMARVSVSGDYYAVTNIELYFPTSKTVKLVNINEENMFRPCLIGRTEFLFWRQVNSPDKPHVLLHFWLSQAATMKRGWGQGEGSNLTLHP